MGFDRKYLVWALAYAAAGMGLGVVMGATHDHGQHVTHAHILLVGFVVSFIYAVIHKLWLNDRVERLARVQFILHQAGALTMLLSLLLLFGGLVPAEPLDPVLALASITVLLGALLMLLMVLRTPVGRAG